MWKCARIPNVGLRSQIMNCGVMQEVKKEFLG